MAKKRYRKVTVDGKEYQYLVGKDYVNVRGVGIVEKHRIGYVIDERIVEVTPLHVVNYIKFAWMYKKYKHVNYSEYKDLMAIADI